MQKRIFNEEQAKLFGGELAEGLDPGAVIALIGGLGSGKTTLTKAIAEGLGIHDIITSPTFAIIQEYKGGRLPLYHFDVYRLASSADMYNLGYEEYFFGDGVTVVEWADRVGDLIPEDALTIYIGFNESPAALDRVYEFNLGQAKKYDHSGY